MVRRGEQKEEDMKVELVIALLLVANPVTTSGQTPPCVTLEDGTEMCIEADDGGKVSPPKVREQCSSESGEWMCYA